MTIFLFGISHLNKMLDINSITSKEQNISLKLTKINIDQRHKIKNKIKNKEKCKQLERRT